MSVNGNSSGGSDSCDFEVARPRGMEGGFGAVGEFNLVHTSAATGKVTEQTIKNVILERFVLRAFSGVVGHTGVGDNDLSNGVDTEAASGSTSATGLNTVIVGLRLSSTNDGDSTVNLSRGTNIVVGTSAAQYGSAAPVGGSATTRLTFADGDTATNIEDEANDLIYFDGTASANSDPNGLFAAKAITDATGGDWTITSNTVTVKAVVASSPILVEAILLVDPVGSANGLAMQGIAGVQVGSGTDAATMSIITLTNNDTLAVTYTLKLSLTA